MNHSMVYLFFVTFIVIGQIFLVGKGETEDKIIGIIIMVLGIINIIASRSPYLGG